MSPTSYQAAPPRVGGAHYRSAAWTVSRNGATGRGGRGGRHAVLNASLKEKEDLAGTAETELLPRDRLDAVRVVAQLVDLRRQPVVLALQGPHLLPQAHRGPPLPVNL